MPSTQRSLEGNPRVLGGQTFLLMRGVVTKASLCVSRRQRNPSLRTPVGLHAAGAVFGNEWLQQQSTPWSLPPLPIPRQSWPEVDRQLDREPSSRTWRWADGRIRWAVLAGYTSRL